MASACTVTMHHYPKLSLFFSSRNRHVTKLRPIRTLLRTFPLQNWTRLSIYDESADPIGLDYGHASDHLVLTQSESAQ